MRMLGCALLGCAPVWEAQANAERVSAGLNCFNVQNSMRVLDRVGLAVNNDESPSV